MKNLDKKQFNGLNILVLGDIILDHFIFGTSNRISPEAPIPVLKINNNKYEVLGGCGNVAKNICGAGSKCHIISVCGDDEESIVLKKLLKDSKKLTFNLFTDQSRYTTKKINWLLLIPKKVIFHRIKAQTLSLLILRSFYRHLHLKKNLKKKMN